MSKFIKVTLYNTDLSSLIPVGEITSIGSEGIYTKDGFVKVNETIEQIEAQLLRDEFAMAVVTGLSADEGYPVNSIVRMAYRVADQMLKERSK